MEMIVLNQEIRLKTYLISNKNSILFQSYMNVYCKAVMISLFDDF